MASSRPGINAWRWVSRGLWIGLLSSVLVGCGGRIVAPPPPDAAVARQALQKALEAWQQGEEPGSLKSATPSIHVADEQWLFGGELREFSIVEEGETHGSQVRFRVRLQTVASGRTAPAPSEVTYLVTAGSSLISIVRDDP